MGRSSPSSLPADAHRPVSSLGVQMLFIGTLCFALALVRLAPVLAVPLLLFTALGWLRNRTIMRRRRESRLANTSWDYFNAFIVSCFEMACLFMGTLVIFILTLFGLSPIFIKEVHPFGIFIPFAVAVVVSVFFVIWILKGQRHPFNPSRRPPYGQDWNRARFPRSTTSFSQFDPATINIEPARGRPASVALDDDLATEGEAVDEDDEEDSDQPRRDNSAAEPSDRGEGPGSDSQTW